MISRLFEAIWNKDYQAYTLSYAIDELKKFQKKKALKRLIY
jgi:hypothetical protein